MKRCKVLPQSAASGTPVPWYYKYDFEPASSAGEVQPSAALLQKQPDVELLNIVGSCDGCGARKKGLDKVVYSGLREYVECIVDNKPHVVDQGSNEVPEIVVSSTVPSVTWQPQGPGALTFTFPLGSNPPLVSPCSNANADASGNVVIKGDKCVVSKDARNDTKYTYYVALDTCNSGMQSQVYFLTLQK